MDIVVTGLAEALDVGWVVPQLGVLMPWLEVVGMY